MNSIVFATVRENDLLYYFVSLAQNETLNLCVFDDDREIVQREVLETEKELTAFRKPVFALFENQINANQHGFYGDSISSERVKKLFKLVAEEKATATT